MRKTTTLLILIFIGHTSFCQLFSSFNKLISETNRFLKTYNQISPYGDDFYSLKESGLTEGEIRQLEKGDFELSQNKDSLAVFDLIYIYQRKIIDNLNKVITHKKLSKRTIENLHDNGVLNIIKSEDNKLYNFTFDAKTGGTYQMQISLMYFTETNSNQLSSCKELMNQESSDAYKIFISDGYSNITTIQTEIGTKYILTGSVRTCSSCFANHISLVSYKNGTFNLDFYYSTHSRGLDSDIDYDKESQTISAYYITDDLREYCYCSDSNENDESELKPEDEEEPGRLECRCLFQFNGLNFELIKQSEEPVKD